MWGGLIDSHRLTASSLWGLAFKVAPIKTPSLQVLLKKSGNRYKCCGKSGFAYAKERELQVIMFNGRQQRSGLEGGVATESI